ncbi:MAG: hypothetical protein SGPRY_013942 [Prymnesium sp.]
MALCLALLPAAVQLAARAELLGTLHSGAQKIHSRECCDGQLNFPPPAAPESARVFSSSDFETHEVGEERAAGPDAPFLRDASCIHITRRPVLTSDEIDDVINEATEAIQAGMQSNFTFTQRNRLGEVHVAHLPKARAWLSTRLNDTFFPMLESCFGVEATSLRVFDSLVIHYDEARGGVRQPVHRDGSLLSLNIALSHSSDFSGGGTLFEALLQPRQMEEGSSPANVLEGVAEKERLRRATLQLERGHAMCHASGLRHAGARITGGERWVLVVFVLSEARVHVGRRAAELAWGAQARGELEWSATLFSACVEIDPTDHELHYGLASTLAMMGHQQAARESLRAAVQLYPSSPKVQAAMGTLLLKARRPRAALRRFELTLALSPDEDEDEVVEACMYAGLCGVRLAQTNQAHAASLLPLAESRLRRAFHRVESSKRSVIEGLLEEADMMSRALQNVHE